MNGDLFIKEPTKDGTVFRMRHFSPRHKLLMGLIVSVSLARYFNGRNTRGTRLIEMLQVSKESGHVVQLVEEKNYMFDMGKVKDSLELWLAQPQGKIGPVICGSLS